MKKRFSVILGLVAIGLFCSSCLYRPSYSDHAWLEYAVETDYVETTVAQVRAKVEAGESLVLVWGSSSCGACETFHQVAREYITSYHQRLYYLSVSIYPTLSHADQTFLGGLVSLEATPSIALIKDGVRVDLINGALKLGDFSRRLARHFVTAPRPVDLATARQMRDGNVSYLLLVAAPDQAVSQEFFSQRLNATLKDHTSLVHILTGISAPLDQAVAGELQVDWLPTLVYFQQGVIADRFQWNDANYLSDDLTITYQSIASTNKELEGRSYSTKEAKQQALISHYNKAYDAWIGRYV